MRASGVIYHAKSQDVTCQLQNIEQITVQQLTISHM